jgi:hypothetical protein
MIIAHRAGIPVFVTGGIGGVHRGAEHSTCTLLQSYSLIFVNFYGSYGH